MYYYDGVTIKVKNVDNEEFEIRLIGINISWSTWYRKTKGEIVRDYLRELIENKEVYIEYDIQKVDKYNRYIYYCDENQLILLQEKLLSLGYCKIMNIKPKTKIRFSFF